MGEATNQTPNAGQGNEDFLAAASKAAESAALSEPIRPTPEGTAFVAVSEPESRTSRDNRPYWAVDTRRLVDGKAHEEETVWFLNDDQKVRLAEIVRKIGTIKGRTFKLYGVPRQFKKGGGIFTAYDNVNLVHTGELDLASLAPRRATRTVDRRLAGMVRDLIADLAAKDEKGAPWDAISAHFTKQGVAEADVDAAIDALTDNGEVFEPILGRLKPAASKTQAQIATTPTAPA